ncbi:MAG: hypothetical protein FWD25_02470 [Clostridia bacterium]|nr:hypothetical protein [Clostridia bacterium]
MRKVFISALVLLTALGCFVMFPAAAQVIELDSVHARLSFPDPWLVVTPASLPVYAGLLREAGLDPEAMEARFIQDGVVAEGWAETFDDSYRLMVREDERSAAIFDIGRATAGDRRAIANAFTSARDNNLRYQVAEWNRAGDLGWALFLRYNVMEGGEIIGRGVQYFTIRNGKNYILDWQLGARRVTNRDIARLKEKLDGLSFTEGLDIPTPMARLEVTGGMPTETGVGEVRLQGFTEPEAGLLLTRSVGQEQVTVTVGAANRRGDFILDFALAAQGEYDLTLTASKDGYVETSVSGKLLYQSGWLAVTIDHVPGAVHEQAFYRLSGTAPTGTELQILIGNRPAVHRKTGNDGRFSLEIDTSLPGEYSVLLIATLRGFNERRISIEFTRVASAQEERDALKAMATRATYAQVLRNPEAFVGEVMTFTGDVVEVSPGVGVWFIRLDVSRTRNDVWPMVLVCDEDPELFVGARITFYARANSPFVEQDTNGNEITVPALSLLWIE